MTKRDSVAARLDSAIDQLEAETEQAPRDLNSFWIDCVRISAGAWARELLRDLRLALRLGSERVRTPSTVNALPGSRPGAAPFLAKEGVDFLAPQRSQVLRTRRPTGLDHATLARRGVAVNPALWPTRSLFQIVDHHARPFAAAALDERSGIGGRFP